jgi:hypothetical protein
VLMLQLQQHAAAQGLKDDREAILGAQVVSAQYLTVYKQALAWARSYIKKPFAKTSCQQQGPGGGSLCSAAQAQEEAAVLLLATTPHKYDARDRSQTGGWDLAGPVGDQGRTPAAYYSNSCLMYSKYLRQPAHIILALLISNHLGCHCREIRSTQH